MCFLSSCLAVAPLNELVTRISRFLPKHFFLHLFYFFLWSLTLVMFSAFMSVCLHSQGIEITDSWGCSQEWSRSLLFFVLSFPFFSSLEFSVLGVSKSGSELEWWGGGWSQESNYAIIAGWSGLARAGEGKMNSMLWGFPNSRSFETTFCRNLTVFTSKDKRSNERLMLKNAL